MNTILKLLNEAAGCCGLEAECASRRDEPETTEFYAQLQADIGELMLRFRKEGFIR